MLYVALQCPVTNTSLPFSSPYQVFRKEHLPRRFHYQNSPRIEPIVIQLKGGYSAYSNNKTGLPLFMKRGDHGYDSILYPSMRSIFFATGPGFKSGVIAEPFKNIELYNLMCELINVTSAPNNGTFGSLHHILAKPLILSETIQQKTLHNEKFLLKNLTFAEVEDVKNKHAPYGIPRSSGRIEGPAAFCLPVRADAVQQTTKIIDLE